MTRVILVVEDNRLVSGMVELVLRQQGLESILMVSATEARRVLRGPEQPGGVLLDLDLPAGSGLALLEELDSDPALAAIPKIVFCGNSTPADRVLRSCPSLAREACIDKHEFDLKSFETLVQRLFVSGRDG